MTKNNYIVGEEQLEAMGEALSGFLSFHSDCGLFSIDPYDARNVDDILDVVLSAIEDSYTVVVDPDPKGISIGVYLGKHCVYHGNHEIPTE